MRIKTEPLAKATKWLAAFRDHWTGSLGQLDRLLTELKSLEE